MKNALTEVVRSLGDILSLGIPDYYSRFMFSFDTVLVSLTAAFTIARPSAISSLTTQR